MKRKVCFYVDDLKKAYAYLKSKKHDDVANALILLSPDAFGDCKHEYELLQEHLVEPNIYICRLCGDKMEGGYAA